MATRTKCRICDSSRIRKFLELGPTPLANRFLTTDQLGEAEPTYALDLHHCLDCSLVQITEVVPPEVLFRDYLYVSGTSTTMARHFDDLAEEVSRRFTNSADDLVIEPASNDGTLLSRFRQRGIRVLGIEPATNIAEMANNRGIETRNDFFTESVGRLVRASHGTAKIVVATNVFAHVDDVHDFVRAAKALMADDGVFVFEASYILDTVDHLEFDSTYHEHLSYFSITALTILFDRHGMEIFDVSSHPVHGGSIRVYTQRKGGRHATTEAQQRYLAEEERRGVRSPELYDLFAAKVHQVSSELLGLIRTLRSEGKRVVAYGASAKGNTLLNYVRLGRDLIEYVVDKSKLKQDRFTPGMHIPVYSVERLSQDRPDYALLLAWNFAEEVLNQQAEYIGLGGRFIVPIPAPRIIP